MYMMIDIYCRTSGPRDTFPMHSCIVTAEEAAEHLKSYQGDEHCITGFMSAAEVEGMTFTERGLAHLDETR